MVSDTAARAAELIRGRVPFVQATVVRAGHPTSARAGDVAVIDAGGTLTGFVGGTCTESSVLAHALAALGTGEPLLLRIRPSVAATTREEGAVTVVNPCLSGGTLEIFLEPRLPAPRVLVVGETPVARALGAIAGAVGFLAELVDGTGAAPGPDDAAVVVASHGRSEEVALEAALRAGVPYVGLVASAARGAAVLASLDVDDEARARVHTPAGLAIGARTAEEIALAIVAELVAERAAVRASPRTGAAAATAVDAAPTTAVDPVCGMSVPTAGGKTSVQHGGGTVYFCGEHCRTTFAEDPARYAAAP